MTERRRVKLRGMKERKFCHKAKEELIARESGLNGRGVREEIVIVGTVIL